jgi:hypothetical protein
LEFDVLSQGYAKWWQQYPPQLREWRMRLVAGVAFLGSRCCVSPGTRGVGDPLKRQLDGRYLPGWLIIERAVVFVCPAA